MIDLRRSILFFFLLSLFFLFSLPSMPSFPFLPTPALLFGETRVNNESLVVLWRSIFLFSPFYFLSLYSPQLSCQVFLFFLHQPYFLGRRMDLWWCFDGLLFFSLPSISFLSLFSLAFMPSLPSFPVSALFSSLSFISFRSEFLSIFTSFFLFTLLNGCLSCSFYFYFH